MLMRQNFEIGNVSNTALYQYTYLVCSVSHNLNVHFVSYSLYSFTTPVVYVTLCFAHRTLPE